MFNVNILNVGMVNVKMVNVIAPFYPVPFRQSLHIFKRLKTSTSFGI